MCASGMVGVTFEDSLFPLLLSPSLYWSLSLLFLPLPPPLLLSYPFPLPPTLPFLLPLLSYLTSLPPLLPLLPSLFLLFTLDFYHLVVSVLNIRVHCDSVDIWYRERTTDSHTSGPHQVNCGYLTLGETDPNLLAKMWEFLYCSISFSKREDAAETSADHLESERATFCCRAYSGRLRAERQTLLQSP